MLQLIIKIAITICLIYIFFLFLKTVWTKEIDLKYPLNWIKNKVEKSIPITTSGINIFPNKIILKTGKWKGISSFNIHNSTQEILYNIYVKLEIEDLRINSQDIAVFPKNESDFIQGQLGDVSVKFDIVKIISTDIRGKECIILIIYSLSPNESKAFKINIKETSDSNVEEAKISVNLIKYSKEPAQVLSQEKNKVAFPISFPEQLTIKGISFFMKKK